ncbi:MAG TPA: 2Fe-2S iron-sulfur cluster-binding protein [bacterium]|nr:(2Fe-2S)-binding protein [Dictyoglomota bacterium]HHV81081.1 molybdopterin-dependent oxidoreductase [bacterium]HOK28984.1 2Fe-2S iron-sulfur cluster-binding protein [bacterium]HOL54554.1 2Fe-2S iron-sulfur cluster-binding protein [bacterium]HPC77022.1 2Fe-2S iron-sulfur cluster-binding protein [bacterium]
MALVNIKVNGQPVQVEEGKTVLEALKEAGIDVPVLCYHPELPSIGACRMCMVETRPGVLQASCTLPVSEGLELQTDSETVTKARKFVLNLIFSERNHYCMYCEMSNNCELQDLGYKLQLDHFDIPTYTTRFPVDATHNYILLDHNRCILCRRCVRACSEIAGHNVLGISQRGIESLLTADLNLPFGESSCVSCGLCVQVCPTGALTDKNTAYLGTRRESEMIKSICANCSVGCGIEAYKRANNLVQILGDWDSPVNNGILCALGRYTPVAEHRERILQPMVKKNGKLETATWEEALEKVREILNTGEVTGYISGDLPLEVLSGFKDLMKGNAGLLENTSNPIDNSGKLEDILVADKILVIGVDLDKNFGVVGSYVKKRVFNGGELILVDDNSNSFGKYARAFYQTKDLDKAIGSALMGNNPVVIYSKTEEGITDSLIRISGKAKFIWLTPSSNYLGAKKIGLNGSFVARKNAYIVGPCIEKLPEGLDRVIVQTSYYTPAINSADVVLPVSTWLEEEGKYINIEGREQKLVKVLNPPKEVKGNREIIDILLAR